MESPKRFDDLIDVAELISSERPVLLKQKQSIFEGFNSLEVSEKGYEC